MGNLFLTIPTNEKQQIKSNVNVCRDGSWYMTASIKGIIVVLEHQTLGLYLTPKSSWKKVLFHEIQGVTVVLVDNSLSKVTEMKNFRGLMKNKLG